MGKIKGFTPTKSLLYIRSGRGYNWNAKSKSVD